MKLVSFSTGDSAAQAGLLLDPGTGFDGLDIMGLPSQCRSET